VGRRPFAIQQPGITQNKSTEAQPDDFSAVLPCPHQAIQQRLRRALMHRAPVRHYHDIGLLKGGEIRAGVERKAVARGQQSRPFGANLQVKAFRFRDAIAKQHTGNRVVERAEPVHGDNRDIGEFHGPSVPYNRLKEILSPSCGMLTHRQSDYPPRIRAAPRGSAGSG
jgi:hypothetical protein